MGEVKCGTTHYTGCACHEARHAAAVARLKAKEKCAWDNWVKASEDADALRSRLSALEAAASGLPLSLQVPLWDAIHEFAGASNLVAREKAVVSVEGAIRAWLRAALGEKP